MSGEEIVIGPCGDPAIVPTVEVRPTATVDGGRVELTVRSEPYCWRVRSWFTPADVRLLASELLAAAEIADPESETR